MPLLFLQIAQYYYSAYAVIYAQLLHFLRPSRTIQLHIQFLYTYLKSMMFWKRNEDTRGNIQRANIIKPPIFSASIQTENEQQNFRKSRVIPRYYLLFCNRMSSRGPLFTVNWINQSFEGALRHSTSLKRLIWECEISLVYWCLIFSRFNVWVYVLLDRSSVQIM